MSHSFILATKWLAQKIERAYCTKPPRYFDREKNTTLLREMRDLVDQLGEALEMGVGAQDTCVEIGSLAVMIAVNLETGKGAPAEEAPPVETAPEKKTTKKTTKAK